MNIIQVLLMPFGLSYKYKTLDQVLSGLIISFFSIVFLVILISLYAMKHNFLLIIVQICSLIYILSLILGFILLMKRIEKLYGMYEEILAFDTKIRPNKKKIGFSALITIIFFSLTYVCFLLLIFFNQELNKVFEQIKIHYHGSITGFISFILIFILQFII